MPISSDADIRPLASRILLVQTGAGAAVALVCLLVLGRYACVSALAGAATGVAANLYMTFKALHPARTPRRALAQLYLGQLVKVALTVVLFMLAARVPHVSWPPLLIAYVATLVVFWWVPFASAPRARIGSRG
ncbi:MAG TPA: ATP synthase subunit I [Steroidobacteraceae bacterium]|nr:ATP synthase subunit I [Steroidobacteraceae bacterium]